jgi:hypothetical protein
MPDGEKNPSSGGFVPRVTLDLDKATPLQFAAAIEELEAYRKSLGDLPPLGLSNGWHTFTAELAEQALLRNAKGANRKQALATVRYYAYSIILSDWKKTGQAIIFTKDGTLVDGQHRLLAGYFCGHVFESYVVSDADPDPFLFAFIDNGRPRSPSTALQTAGQDGLSAVIYAIARIEQNVLTGAYSMHKVSRALRMTPIQVLRAVQEDSRLREAAHLTMAEYGDAVAAIGSKDIAAYTSYKILCVADDLVLEEFMRALTDDQQPEGSPIAALQKWLEHNRKSDKPMPKHLVLAHIAKAFSLWRAGESVRKLKVTVDESFPEFGAVGSKE